LSLCKINFTFDQKTIKAMSNKLLLPNQYKIVGWCLLIPSLIAGIVLSVLGYEYDGIKFNTFAIFNGALFEEDFFFTVFKTDMTNTIIGSLFIIGGLLVGFSREKKEDEFIANIRLSSLLWAVFVNYILLLFSFMFVYGTAFFNVMIYNMFTVLIIFIGRFNYLLYKASKSAESDEK